MTEPISARRTHTRERLVDAAVSVFARKGVHGASVEEICEAAGFTRGAFYSNFDSKDALCLAVLARMATRHLTATHGTIAALPGAAAAPTQLALDDLADRAIAIFLRFQSYDRESLLAAVELRLYAVRHESLRADYLAFVERVGAEFTVLIERTAAQFGYRLTTPGPQALAVIQGAYEQSAISALLRGASDSDAAPAEVLAGVLKSMLAPA